MIDRLKDLQKIAINKGIKLEEPGDQKTFAENEEMKEFTIKISIAHSYVKSILVSVEHLQEIRGDIQTTVGTDKEKLMSTRINEHVLGVQYNQQKMKIILDKLQEGVKEAKEQDKENKNPETRIKVNLLGSLLKQYEDACTRFQTVESEIKNFMQEKIVRSAEIVLGKRLDADEKEQVLMDPGQVQKIYEDKLKAGAHVQLQNAVADIEERHRDIQKLEKSINQVHQLFLELAALVQLQGEIVDNIYNNIASAKDYVLKAEVDIVQSKKNMQSARKKKCCIMIIVIVILIVIVAPTLGVTLTKA